MANSFKQESGNYVWEWILKVWDNGGNSIKLDHADLIDMGLLSEDPRFNMEASTVKEGVKSLLEFLSEALVKRWPTEKRSGMPDFPWLNVDEGILRLRKTEMLEWGCCGNPPQWEDQEDTPFTDSLR